MDRRQIAVKLTLEYLGLKFGVRTFEERLILQKSIYLAQAAGVELGYYYRWYLRGPYCPSLTDDGFEIGNQIAVGSDNSKGWKLERKAQAILNRLKPLFLSESVEELAEKLEPLASVHFIIDRAQPESVKPAMVVDNLQRGGKLYNIGQVEKTLVELRQYGFVR